MNQMLVNSITVFGKPYGVTRSRLGAITKVFTEKYFCDAASLHELFQTVADKLSEVPHAQEPEFSFLISYVDKTHHDGVIDNLLKLKTIAIGKKTDRVVMRWGIKHEIDGIENELSVTVRIANPVNPLVMLQAALSKSPGDLDNFEFELGSTCVTVDGATQAFADEVYMRVQSWIDARNRPHAFTNVHEYYFKYEWYLDQLNISLFPLLGVFAFSLGAARSYTVEQQIVMIPVATAAIFAAQSVARKINSKMRRWAEKARFISLFQLTNGDIDALTKLAAQSKNSLIKLIVSACGSFVVNVAAGVLCWYLFESK